ncbi:RHS repeat-associated protein [Pseudomonas sp. 3400]|nr:RHS repeat-associated protein [Pseudomonas sp. 3400]MDR7011331.1 RHS repeat-associated protein [Pseudomonas alcaliphila]
MPVCACSAKPATAGTASTSTTRAATTRWRASTAARLRYYHTDPNGLPQQLTEDDGRCIWQARYQVWGNTLAEQQESFFVEEQNLRFQGQYLDRETGLHYNTFRFYDPDIGRFISPDPIGLAGGINLFQYAPEPFGWVDPWGWAPTPLNKEGFVVYGLYEPGASDPYYVGHTEQSKEARARQHRQSGRLQPGSRIEILKGEGGNLTYTQAKGYEQAYREKYRTKTGFPGNVIEPINKKRTDARGRSHYKQYRAAARAIGIKASRC